MGKNKKTWTERPKRLLRITDLKQYLPPSLKIDELKKILRLAKLILTRKDNPLKLGEIVFDERDHEFGVVLGEKPNGNMLYASGLEDHKKLLYRNYLVMTLTEDDGNLNFRVRYLNSGMITRIDVGQKVGENDLKGSIKALSDLEFFCKYQCLLECDEECALWKYTRKVKLPGNPNDKPWDNPPHIEEA